MSVDFGDAHIRHWKDAELLFGEQRLANADHLYGMTAECGLKRLMLAFGMRMTNDKPAVKDDRVHADGIWNRYESYRSGHVHGTGYPLSVTVNPFSDWNVEQRYFSESFFDYALVRRHQEGAQCVRSLVDTAQRNGLI